MLFFENFVCFSFWFEGALILEKQTYASFSAVCLLLAFVWHYLDFQKADIYYFRGGLSAFSALGNTRRFQDEPITPSPKAHKMNP